jgi:ketosteroid isomerase-like protein
MTIDRRLLTFGSIGALTLSTVASTSDASAASAEEFARHFLRTFENLDMPSFVACFADDASVFFPLPEPPQRFDGKTAIREHFQQVFDAIRAGAKSGPPYHELHAEDLAVRRIGAAAAVITFHLRSAQRIARRTLVLGFERGWRIVHLHASNVANGPAA